MEIKKPTHWMGLIVEWRWQRKESLNLKNSAEFTQSEQSRDNRLKNKMNCVSGICRTITRDPTFISLESQKERRKHGVFEEQMAENFPNLAKQTQQSQEAE